MSWCSLPDSGRAGGSVIGQGARGVVLTPSALPIFYLHAGGGTLGRLRFSAEGWGRVQPHPSIGWPVGTAAGRFPPRSTSAST